MLAATLAIVLNNSVWSGLYQAFLGIHFAIRLGGIGLDKPLLLWINDGLMAIFFVLVGLEIKREALFGRLSTPRRAALPRETTPDIANLPPIAQARAIKAATVTCLRPRPLAEAISSTGGVLLSELDETLML